MLIKYRQLKLDKKHLDKYQLTLSTIIKDTVKVDKYDKVQKIIAKIPYDVDIANIKCPDDYVYVIKEREFIKTNEDIYKIGRTIKGHSKRVLQYPKGSLVLDIIKVPDAVLYEKEIKRVFNKKFIQRKDIGTEYFETTLIKLRKQLYKIVDHLDNMYKKPDKVHVSK